MWHRGKEVNLQQYVDMRYQESRENLLWEEEGLIWAIQDYESSVGFANFSEEDIKWLKDNNLWEVTELFDKD